MFEKTKHKWQVRGLVQKREKLLNSYEPALGAAHDKDDMETLSDLLSEREFEVGQVDDELDYLLSEYYRRRADGLRLVSPTFSTTDGTFIQGKYSKRWCLNREEISKLRSAVRQEEKERLDEWRTWLALLIGFGGMLIGLISMLKK